MSRAGRIAHEHHVNKHAQRQFGTVKPKLQPEGTETMWFGEFISSAQGIGSFNINALIVLQLGATAEERMLKLRQASRAGLLRMSAYREDGQFVEYRWELTATMA